MAKEKVKKIILIVEDDAVLAGALSDKFTSEKFLTKVARNGRTGLVAFKKFKPDLILLDIVMPVMDGLEMLKKLRQDPVGKRAKVIVLTNLNDAAKTAEAVEEGVKDYLVKSDWKISDLVKKVNEKLK